MVEAATFESRVQSKYRYKRLHYYSVVIVLLTKLSELSESD